MKQIDTLVDDIYTTLKTGATLPPAVKAHFQEVCGGILEKAVASKDVARGHIRMSGIGKPNRQFWYESKGFVGEELSGSTYLKFTYGDVIEALVLALAEVAGHSVTNYQQKVTVDGINGSIDACIDGELIDVKSASSYSYSSKFKDVAELGGDEFGYYGQAAGYEAGMNQPFLGWLAVDKQLGHIRLSKAVQESIPDARSLIAEKRAVEAMDAPPERCYPDVPFQKSGNMALDTGCSYCKFKAECWKDANEGAGLRTFLYANKPVSFTKIVKEPLVGELK